MTRSKKTGRISSTLPLYHFSERFARCASAASLAAFLQFPAFFSSCTKDIDRKEEEVQLLLTTKSAVPEAVDLFFFDTLGIQRLDAYQQISDWSQTVYGLSATGVKRLVALSGKSGDQAAWSSIRTYGDLCKHRFSLERESVRSPLLYGELLLKDGVSRRAQMELHPMLAAIRLRSVSCDFSGRPYVNGNFLCKQLFLTYAGSECLPLGQGDGGPVSWLNPGFLDSTAIRQLPDTSLVWQRGFGAVGRQRTYPDRFFYCYPGADTHLVLEGELDGTICYYPIPLTGLAPDICLQLDITLRRMGSSGPDIPTISGAFTLETQKLPWEEWEPYSVTY